LTALVTDKMNVLSIKINSTASYADIAPLHPGSLLSFCPIYYHTITLDFYSDSLCSLVTVNMSSKFQQLTANNWTVFNVSFQ